MTHTKDEALKLALEALKIARDQIVDPEYAPIGWSVSRLDEVLANGQQALAQPAPVQEPFCFYYVENGEEYFAPKGAYVPDNAQPLYTTAAQPAVPDAFGTREGEHPQYIEGWNDCRAEMLKARDA
jgi:hypothetical protein